MGTGHGKNIKERKLKTTILAIDIGAGTQDIAFYDDTYEDLFKLILPSPTLINANKVEAAKRAGKNIIMRGEIMGGGPFVHAIKKYLRDDAGRVCMAPTSSKTVDDDADEVQKKGIEIVSEGEAQALSERDDFAHIDTRDFTREAFEMVASRFSIELDPDIVCVAVQDHGVAPKGTSDRRYRFENFARHIPGTSHDFGSEDPDAGYSRMHAAKRILSTEFPDARHLVMDTKVAAMFGATHEESFETAIVTDVGNGHTTMAAMDGDRIVALMEHHTSMITAGKMETYYRKLIDGTLENDDIFNDGGHGAYIAKAIGSADVLLATGPKRTMLRESTLDVTYADPIGDVMITGCIGLIEAAKQRFY